MKYKDNFRVSSTNKDVSHSFGLEKENIGYYNPMYKALVSLMNMHVDSIIETIHELKCMPFNVITLGKFNQISISKLMYEFELLTLVCAQYTYINVYDKLAERIGKIILKDKLKSYKSIHV